MQSQIRKSSNMSASPTTIDPASSAAAPSPATPTTASTSGKAGGLSRRFTVGVGEGRRL